MKEQVVTSNMQLVNIQKKKSKERKREIPCKRKEKDKWKTELKPS
jgi:hypothetical protein